MSHRRVLLCHSQTHPLGRVSSNFPIALNQLWLCSSKSNELGNRELAWQAADVEATTDDVLDQPIDGGGVLGATGGRMASASYYQPVLKHRIGW